MNYSYEYDQVVHTFPSIVTDVFGNMNQTVYDYRLGLPTWVQDISGNVTEYTYYKDGKPKTIRGPKEIESGAPYTIKFEYNDEFFHNIGDTAYLWAKTLHFDPLNQGNKIITFSFSDCLGRNIQTSKHFIINGIDSLLVSGVNHYDVYGRIIKTSLPVSLPIIDYGVVPFDSVPRLLNNTSAYFDSTTYDILDRPVFHKAHDQTTMHYQYGFETDGFGKIRFVTTTTDPNNYPTSTFTNSQGLKTSITNSMNGITKFLFNPLGELLESVDPENNSTTYTYDKLGRMTQRDHPDAGITAYTYDGAGNLLTTQTAKLAISSQVINYEYDYNRLIKVNYPENPENNVYYKYGDASTGNNSGKIISMRDASGIQNYEYGSMGELVRNIHTFVVPGGEPYTFEMNWKYDCWNRIKEMTYPDGETVYYTYNNTGQLYSLEGIKNGDPYTYINHVVYDMYGKRTLIQYGNATHTTYEYNPLNQLLTNLKSYDPNQNLMQDLDYTYDNTKNITEITNSAGYLNGNLGGEYNYQYTYDSLYRLTNAEGLSEAPEPPLDLTFELNMSYSPSGNITNKSVSALTWINNNLGRIDYDNNYDYNDRPHTLTRAGSFDYGWDLNGNLESKKSGDGMNNRILCWDEENRLANIRDINCEINNISSYLYNAGGDRTWKLTGEEQIMLINGTTSVSTVDFAKTLYTSPYMVMNDQEYTKHYFIEGERVCTKIGGGFLHSYGDPLGDPIVDRDSLGEIADDLWELVTRGADCWLGYSAFMDSTLGIEYELEGDRENNMYFYHSDHLGSSSLITNMSSAVIQHLQYLPFGETFVDERTNDPFNTPYKFSGKEKDDETQYSYFGARYYDSDLSIWLSVDPMADKYPSMSPFMYCAGNPVMLVDPDGNKIRPINAKADAAIDYLSQKYGEFLRIPTPSENNVYTSGKHFSNINEFTKAFKKELKNKNCKFTKDDFEEAWKFQNVLADNKILEFSVFTTSNSETDFTSSLIGNKTEGERYSGEGIMTSNNEYGEFIDYLKSSGGELNPSTSKVLYEGKESGKNGTKTSISPDKKGKGWVYFKNQDSNKNVKGHLILDGTNKTNYQNSKAFIDVLE